MSGADPEQLEALSTTFKTAGERIRRSQEVITSLVERNRWSGRDADAFLATWRSKSAPRLRVASDVLADQAATLRRQASDQRTASGASGVTSQGSRGRGGDGATAGGGGGGGGGAAGLGAAAAGVAVGAGAGGGSAGGATEGGGSAARGGGSGAGGSQGDAPGDGARTLPDGGAGPGGDAADGGADDGGADDGGVGGVGGVGDGEGGGGGGFGAGVEGGVSTLPAEVVGWDDGDPAFGGWTPPPMAEDGWAAAGDGGAGLAGGGPDAGAGPGGGAADGARPGEASFPDPGAALAAEPAIGGAALAGAEPGPGPGEVLSNIGAGAMDPRFLVGGVLGGGAMIAREALKSRDSSDEYLGEDMAERTGLQSLGLRPGIGREHALRLGGALSPLALPRSASAVGARAGLPDGGD